MEKLSVVIVSGGVEINSVPGDRRVAASGGRLHRFQFPHGPRHAFHPRLSLGKEFTRVDDFSWPDFDRQFTDLGKPNYFLRFFRVYTGRCNAFWGRRK